MSNTRNQSQNRSESIGNRSPAELEKQWRETRTRLNKHILKLIFSHLGRSEDLDYSIKNFKTGIQKAGNDKERNELIENAIEEILRHSDAAGMELKQTESNDTELFVELLNKLSISHDHADEFVKLRDRIRDIQEHQEHLDIISETIKLLTANPDTAQSNSKELVLNLIEYIRLPKDSVTRLEDIKQQIHRNTEASGLVKLLKNVSEIINDANEKLQNEFRDIRQYITRVIGQLGELNEFLTNSLNEQQLAFTESRKLKAEFVARNETLQQKVDSTSNLEEIKECVNSHIAVVNENLKSHIELETKRHASTGKQMKKMQKELKGMQKQCNSLKKNLMRAKQKAMHDVLTGLPNRLAFNERFREEFSRYQRYNQTLSLAVLDIDYFKKVNDTYGHKAGDKVLKAVAEVCNSNIREADFLARFGGEEFVLLLPATQLQQAAHAMDKLRVIIEDCHFHYSDQSVPITVSIGVAEMRAEDTTETIFKRADEALYAAKGNGRNRCITEQQLDSAA